MRLTFTEEAMRAIAKLAVERKTGARGLRAIMESLMLTTMYEVPARKDIAEVQITAEAVNGTQKPSSATICLPYPTRSK